MSSLEDLLLSLSLESRANLNISWHKATFGIQYIQGLVLL